MAKRDKRKQKKAGNQDAERLIPATGLTAGLNTSGLAALAGTNPPKGTVTKPGAGIAALALGKGRQTHPSSAVVFNAFSWLPRRQTVASLQTLDLTHYTPEQLVEMLSDSDPSFSMAVWNMVRLVNSGYGITCRDLKDEKDYPEAQKACYDFLKRVNIAGGGMDPLLATLTISIFNQGAACVEAPPMPDLSGVEDIYIVAPWSVRFRWVNQGTQDRPQLRLAMQQWVPSYPDAVWLNPSQVFYVPLDPGIDDPYGRAPAFAAIGPILFWLDVLRDLQRAVHTQAWDRYDVTLMEQIVVENAPEDVRTDPDKLRTYVLARLKEIRDDYAKIEPDDAFVHTDATKITTVNAAGRTFDAHPMLQAIEQLVIRGVKQLPTLMGGGANTRGAGQLGSLEYQIYSTAVASMQGILQYLMERVLGLHLRLLGMQATVHFDWNPIRTTDRLKEAQAQTLEIKNSISMYQQGWISQDEASQANAGHEPDQETPRQGAGLALGSGSPPPLPTNDQNPMDGKEPIPGAMPTPRETTGEGGDQAGAPKPSRNGRREYAITAP